NPAEHSSGGVRTAISTPPELLADQLGALQPLMGRHSYGAHRALVKLSRARATRRRFGACCEYRDTIHCCQWVEIRTSSATANIPWRSTARCSVRRLHRQLPATLSS